MQSFNLLVLALAAVVAVVISSPASAVSPFSPLPSKKRYNNIILKSYKDRHVNHASSNLDIRGGASGVDMSKVKLPRGTFSVGRLLEIHKALWLPVSLSMMYYYENFSARACLMAALFGSYGVIWVIKSYVFWDKTFYNDPMCHVGIGGSIFSFLLVCIYFLFPWLAVKNAEPIQPVAIFASCLCFALGSFLHYAGDCQKFFTLKYKGSGLITEGFFSKLRDPSYVGEDLIWIAFTIVAGIKNRLILVPWVYFAFGILTFYFKKTSSLSRYPEYEEWKKKTWI